MLCSFVASSYLPSDLMGIHPPSSSRPFGLFPILPPQGPPFRPPLLSMPCVFGLTTLLVLFLGTLLYIGLGCFWKIRTKGGWAAAKEETGGLNKEFVSENFPHKGFWLTVPRWEWDGIRTVYQGCRWLYARYYKKEDNEWDWSYLHETDK
eukprot:gene4452-4700_t